MFITNDELQNKISSVPTPEMYDATGKRIYLYTYTEGDYDYYLIRNFWSYNRYSDDDFFLIKEEYKHKVEKYNYELNRLEELYLSKIGPPLGQNHAKYFQYVDKTYEARRVAKKEAEYLKVKEQDYLEYILTRVEMYYVQATEI